MRNRYTRDFLEPLVRDSISVSEVCRKAGVNDDGWMNSYVGKKIKILGIDTSHFLGRRANSGSRHVGGCTKRTPKEIFEFKKDVRACQLRRALIESGIEYKCELCDIRETWRNQYIVLHVDHRNGNDRDNRKSNLRFLCPNCHSQTPTFGSKRRGP